MNGITEGNLITDGNSRAVVVASTEAFLICVPENGGAEFALSAADASAWNAVGVEAPTLVIERPFTVYAVDGTRVDGYRFESRARRNNDERFAGTGYFIAKLDPSTFEYVSA